MDVTKPCRDLNKLSAKGKIACELFLAECKKQGLNVLVTETYRSQERQSYLYEQGRTRQGIIVTNVKKVGYHNSGNAWDICKNVKGHEYDDYDFFLKCGFIAKRLNIEWGGSWKSFPDNPHFQINNDWQPPQQDDNKLFVAVQGLINKGYSINLDCWKRKELINLKNVDALLHKLGGIAKLNKKYVITQPEKWIDKTYNVDDVIALLIKANKYL